MKKQKSIIQERTQETLSLKILETLKLINILAKISLGTKSDSSVQLPEHLDKALQSKLLNLEADLETFKHSITEELTSLKSLIEQSITFSLRSQDQVLRSVLAEIYKKFPMIHEGTILKDLDMGNKAILNLTTPETLTISCAASTYYVKEKLQPLEKKLQEIENKIPQKDTLGKTLEFSPLGDVNLNGHRLSGLAFPEADSDAISREYLEHYLQDLDLQLPKKDFRPKTLSRKTNLLYTLGINSKLKNSLPVDLLLQGLVGFVWHAETSSHQGYFPFDSIKHKQTQEEMLNFVLSPRELLGAHPGTYTWAFTLQALIPSFLNLSHPKIHICAKYQNSPWASLQEELSSKYTQAIDLHVKGKKYFGGQSFDIVELSAENPQHCQKFLVPPNCRGFSLEIKNTLQDQENHPVDLYVLHATHSCYWEAF